MGSHEREKSSNLKEAAKEAKEEKTPPISQEQQPVATTTGAPDWPGFQAYSPMPPAGYLASSPQPHPYMWGVQQFMPPYGTPPHPYVAMYPYAHPSMPPGSYPFNPYPMPTPNGIAETSVNNPGSTEADGKNSDGKEKLPIKRSKGSLGSLNMITGRNNEPGKTSGASANGGYSKSGDSASEGSSEGSDANSQNESPTKSVHRQDSAETSQNGSAAHATQNGGSNASHPMVNSMALAVTGGVSGPTTNLNIGMDYWGAGASSTVPAIHGQVPSAPVAGGIPAARDGAQSQVWLQDERELKRQRRKQSNRESARRSRLRKQAECDELAQRADVLKAENSNLRAEVTRIRSEYDQLLAQNAALKERLGEATAQDDPRSGQNNPHIDIEG